MDALRLLFDLCTKAHLLHKAFLRAVRNTDTDFPFPLPETEPQKFRFRGFLHFALLRIDLQLQLSLQKLLHAFQYPLSGSLRLDIDVAVSGPREFHPRALSEPDVNLSAHPAPIIQPRAEFPSASVQTSYGFVLSMVPPTFQ